jgi:predicted Rossmann fold nucleotide-binding protein DprA/Smf involved in DNA uptake
VTFGPPNHVWIGNHDIVAQPLLVLACSAHCPPRLVLKAYDLASRLRDRSVPVVGGFHTPIERDCLQFLLKGSQPIVVCPARSIERMRVPQEWKAPLASGRLLVVSRIPDGERRVTARLAEERNRLVAELCSGAVVIHAVPGGRTEAWCRGLLGQDKPLWTLDDPANAHLVALGARPFHEQALPDFFGK